MCTVIGWFIDVNKDHWIVSQEGNYCSAQCAETGDYMRIIGTPAEYGLIPDKDGYPFNK